MGITKPEHRARQSVLASLTEVYHGFGYLSSLASAMDEGAKDTLCDLKANLDAVAFFIGEILCNHRFPDDALAAYVTEYNNDLEGSTSGDDAGLGVG